MKVLATAVVATAFILGAHTASAATLGTIEYQTFIHTSPNYKADLGGVTTADGFDDRYLFKVDAGTPPLNTAEIDAQLNLIVGRNTGISNAAFSLYKSDAAGNMIGPALAMQDVSGRLVVGGLNPSGTYMLRVTGNLRADNPATRKKDESTNVGQYKIVLGLSPVPIPPAILLLLPAVGALFGLSRLRTAATVAA